VAVSVEPGNADLQLLTERVMVPGATEPFGAYLFRSDELGAELGRHLERAAFYEAFGNTPELLAEEYGPYEPSSFFICVIDHMRRLPAGVMRVLQPSTAGFKTLEDLQAVWGEPAEDLIARTGLEMDQRRTWDVATYAVAAEYRSAKAATGFVSMGLYQTLTLAARCCGILWFIAILDLPVFRILRWKLHMIFAGFKGVSPKPYLGSTASIPAWCDVTEAERRLAQEDPDLHAILVRGIGLEHALRVADLSTLVANGCRPRLAAGQ
jgi:hypothetical protein